MFQEPSQYMGYSEHAINYWPTSVLPFSELLKDPKRIYRKAHAELQSAMQIYCYLSLVSG